MSVIDSAEILLGRSLTDAEYGKAAVLGWCIELVRCCSLYPSTESSFCRQFQAFCLVSDDVMDKCHVRRTQPCWYRLPHVRLIAVNDACMLRSAIFHLLKKCFRQETYYVDVLELFHDVCFPLPRWSLMQIFPLCQVSFNTDMGQLVDLITASEDTVDLSKFSLERSVIASAVCTVA